MIDKSSDLIMLRFLFMTFGGIQAAEWKSVVNLLIECHEKNTGSKVPHFSNIILFFSQSMLICKNELSKSFVHLYFPDKLDCSTRA